MARAKSRLADTRTPPGPQPVTVTRTSARPLEARALALKMAGGDEGRLVTQPGGWVLIVNRPAGIPRT